MSVAGIVTVAPRAVASAPVASQSGTSKYGCQCDGVPAARCSSGSRMTVYVTPAPFAASSKSQPMRAR